MAVNQQQAAQIQRRATANQQQRVPTGRPANPGVQGGRSSSPQYNNPYGMRGEQERLEDARFQQGRRDALNAQRQNRIRDDNAERIAYNQQVRAEIAAGNERAANQRNIQSDRLERQQQFKADDRFRNMQSGRDFQTAMAQNDTNRYATEMQTNAQRYASELQAGVENNRTGANSRDNLANLMGQLASTKANMDLERERTLAGLVTSRWDNDTQRQRNWMDGYSNIANSMNLSGNNYKYWG